MKVNGKGRAIQTRYKDLCEGEAWLKGEFLANTSHELRTPLTAIVGWSRLLRSGGLDQKAAAHAFEVIDRNAWSLTRIVEDMLDVSRIITGKLLLMFVPIDLLGGTVEARNREGNEGAIFTVTLPAST